MERCDLMIYTSYFGNIKKFPDNFEPINIARWKPQWYKGKSFIALAPSDMLLRWWRTCEQNEEDKKRYKQIYMQGLSNYNAKVTARCIREMAGDKIPVLLCFEKSGFCHRHLVREWFQKNGIKCEEWKG